MSLQPGSRFAVAPHFHLPVDWSRRLLVGTGIGEVDGFFPCGPWHPPTDDELTHLVGSAGGAHAEDPDGLIELFRLPEHLRAGWWQLLERAAGATGGDLPGYDAFVARVVEFLAFKNVLVPDGASCDAVVSRPGQRSVRSDPENGRPSGMSCSLFAQTPWPVPEEARVPRLWGGINLGDKATAVVLINLPCRRMDAESRRAPTHPPATVGELVERFLRTCPDYPPVRLILEAGEGYRLPRGGLVVDGSAEGKEEPDVLLLITDRGGRGPGASSPPAEAGAELRSAGDGIWLTGCLLSPDECSSLVAAAEAEGFRPAHLKAAGRNNSEIFFRLPELSEAIRVRLGGRTRGAGVDFEVTAVSPGFECYRYQEGDFVSAHRDASLEVLPDRQSDLSLVLYLNEGFQGGETSFPDQRLNLRPVRGEGVLFRHSLLHEGTPVRSGRKYVARTSVAVSRS